MSLAKIIQIGNSLYYGKVEAKLALRFIARENVDCFNLSREQLGNIYQNLIHERCFVQQFYLQEFMLRK